MRTVTGETRPKFHSLASCICRAGGMYPRGHHRTKNAERKIIYCDEAHVFFFPPPSHFGSGLFVGSSLGPFFFCPSDLRGQTPHATDDRVTATALQFRRGARYLVPLQLSRKTCCCEKSNEGRTAEATFFRGLIAYGRAASLRKITRRPRVVATVLQFKRCARCSPSVLRLFRYGRSEKADARTRDRGHTVFSHNLRLALRVTVFLLLSSFFFYGTQRDERTHSPVHFLRPRVSAFPRLTYIFRLSVHSWRERKERRTRIRVHNSKCRCNV